MAGLCTLAVVQTLCLTTTLPLLVHKEELCFNFRGNEYIFVDIIEAM